MVNSALYVFVLLLLLTTGTAVRVRLIGGSGPYEGRVEVYYGGRWGTVCDDYFTNAAARVVCFSLGYGRGGYIVGRRYGAGSARIWFDDVRCTGSETSISSCPHRIQWSEVGSYSCSRSEAISVSCIIVRLVDGPSPREGRLEV